MRLKAILSPERTLWDAPGGSKKRTFQSIASFLAEHLPHFTEQEIYDSLLGREKLGSTAIGKGIAIPHSRIENCVKTTGGLFRLNTPVDFEALDEEPVDLIFVLLVPAEANDAHLQTLSELATLFSNEEFTSALRACESSEELYSTALSQADQILDLPQSA